MSGAAQHEEVTEFLSRPESYGLRRGTVERIDTHISVVFLAGARAYKLKRPVVFPYLNYSTLEKRRAACEREVQLNRRTASHLYRGVLAVTREADGGLALGGIGEPVEWLVEMNRFDQSQLLDRLAAADRFDVPLAARLADVVAFFHDGARPRPDHGGSAAMRQVIDGNLREMLDDSSRTLDPQASGRLHAASTAAIDRYEWLLDARRIHGLVRQCHGDLHLHNAFLSDGEPTLFDAIEFDDHLACIDVMYDFAFLLMDLWHRGLRGHANAALNAYLHRRADYRGLTLLPLFLSCRAAVRAKVSVAAAAVHADAEEATQLREEARGYLREAHQLLSPVAPGLIAIGGWSGSGKSTLAALLAPSIGPVPGAVVIRTDVVRKQMFGVDVLHPLPAAAYDHEVTAAVYARVLHIAEACLRSGHSAIVDAVFGEPRHRTAIERVAAEAGVPFRAVWLEVPYEVARRRLVNRVSDASDATIEVLAAQVRTDVGTLEWPRLDGRSFDPANPLGPDDLRLAVPTS